MLNNTIQNGIQKVWQKGTKYESATKECQKLFLPLSIFFHFLVHDTKMWVSPSSIIYLGKFASNLFGLSSLFAFLFEPHVLPFHLCSFAPFLCHGRGSNSSLTPFRVRLQFAFAHSFQSPLSLSLYSTDYLTHLQFSTPEDTHRWGEISLYG